MFGRFVRLPCVPFRMKLCVIVIDVKTFLLFFL